MEEEHTHINLKAQIKRSGGRQHSNLQTVSENRSKQNRSYSIKLGIIQVIPNVNAKTKEIFKYERVGDASLPDRITANNVPHIRVGESTLVNRIKKQVNE